MKFYQRLSYYLFGAMLGCFILIGILNQKKTRCSYFPNARVLNNISTKAFQYSEKASQKIAQKLVDTIDIKNTLKYGDVDFDKSNIPINNGKQYTIIGKTTKNVPIALIIINYEQKAVLTDIQISK